MMNDSKLNASPDILQINMEMISKELNDLIVTGEMENGLTQQFSMAAVKTTGHSYMNAPMLENIFQANTFHHQQLICNQHDLLNMKCNQSYYPTVQQSVPQSDSITNVPLKVAGTSSTINNHYICAGKYVSYSSTNTYQANHSNATGLPSYEFHYLQNCGENEKKFSASMSSLGGQGSQRKTIKLTHTHFNHKMQNSRADNDEVEFDLSALDILNPGKDNSIVSNLFHLLRDLHCAVAETPPSFDLESYSQFEETFAPSTKKSSMPSTLNVQNQVKQACRKLTIFTYEMQRILTANKIFHNELYAECEFYLSQLRQYLNQLEMYKRIVMEHKHGQFLREEVKAHAERLSILLEHTNRQIREVNGRILAVDWYIGIKYRGDVHVAAAHQFQTANNEEISKKSEIGVINEILQLCNMKETTTTAEKTTKVETAAANPNNTNNLPTKLNNNPESISYKNNEIFNVYKPEQIKRAAAAGGHTRQPVFYIG